MYAEEIALGMPETAGPLFPVEGERMMTGVSVSAGLGERVLVIDLNLRSGSVLQVDRIALR